MEKRFGVPLREGMLMLSPAGASDMALISADIGVSSPRLILVQVYRLLIATAVFPQICLVISEGATASVILVLLVLPGVMAAFDRWVVPKKHAVPKDAG